MFRIAQSLTCINLQVVSIQFKRYYLYILDVDGLNLCLKIIIVMIQNYTELMKKINIS